MTLALQISKLWDDWFKEESGKWISERVRVIHREADQNLFEIVVGRHKERFKSEHYNLRLLVSKIRVTKLPTM